MKYNPLFTIITPVYNRADCIKRCIESVVSQNFDLYELIIINDGSTDETLNEIKTIEARYNKITVINYDVNKGVNYARNRGIEKAKGNFIIFLDSDDYLVKNALNIIDEAIRSYPGYEHYLFINDVDNNMIHKNVHEYSYADWLSENVSGDFAHVIKTSCFYDLMFVEKFRIYERLNWMRVLRNNKKQLFIPTVVSCIERDREDSVSKEASLDNIESMQNTYNFLYQFIEWYKNDFVAFNISKILQKHIKSALIIGLAIGEKERNSQLINLLENSPFIKIIYKIINRLNVKILFYNIIRIKSKYNQRQRK